MNKVKCITFLILFFVTFLFVQRIFVPKKSYPSDLEHYSPKYKEYTGLEDDTVQVVFTGTSHVLYSMNPMQLYQERKIRAYNLGMVLMRPSMGYYYLKEMLKHQHPQVLMLDVSSLYLKEFTNSWWRLVLDTGFPLNLDKVDASVQYAKEFVADKEKKEEEEKELKRKKLLENREYEKYNGDLNSEDSDPASEYLIEEASSDSGETMKARVGKVNDMFNAELSALVPLYNYHDRWASLTQYDFEPGSKHAYYGKGYVFSVAKGSTSATPARINEVAETLSKEKSYLELQRLYGTYHWNFEENALYTSEVDEEELKWLYKIYDLCKENDIELVLYKVPVRSTYRSYGSSWTQLRSREIRQIAKEMGVYFFDLVYDVNLNITEKDFSDSGKHLNTYGAEKVTHYIGNILQNVLGVKGSVNDYYQRSLPAYKRITAVTDMQYLTEYRPYLKYLKTHLTGRTVFFAVQGVSNGYFNEDELSFLHDLGLEMPGSNQFGDIAYVAVIRNGKVIYEAQSKLPVEKSLLIDEETRVSLQSVCTADTSNMLQKASIMINDVEYALNAKGLNIVVFDNATHCVVDRLSFYKTEPEDSVHCDRVTQKLEQDIKLYENLVYDQYERYF